MPAEDRGGEAAFSRLKHLEHLVEIISRSQRGYRELVDGLEDPVFTLSLDGEIQAANRAFAGLVGKQFRELIGHRFDEFFDDPNRGSAEKALPGFLEKGSWSGIVRARPKHTSAVHYFDCVLHAMVKGRQVVGISGLARDVTERIHLEAQLRQSQKMEAIGRLAGGVAHDFNNLLTVIKGYSDLLLDQLSGDVRLGRAVEEIRKAADRAVSLTRQLLAFSRQQVLEPKELDLNGIVANLHTLLRRLIGEDIELVNCLEPGLDRVKADPGQIEQILLNLAVNARDAMPEGGRLSIATTNVELDADYARHHLAIQPGRYVMLAMSDTGCGMDARIQARIFEPFFTTKESGKGTGLGLSTVYGVVKQSGGYIIVDSQPGQGATFRIYLPRVEAAAEVVEPGPAVAAPASGSETILLVEDEENVRQLLSELLRRNGYTVLEARDGAEAVSIGESHPGPIHLLMTDLVMPHRSGPEVAQRLASRHPGMKVLYMSGYTDEAIVRQKRLDPGIAFLQKPFTAVTLAHKVRDVLGSA